MYTIGSTEKKILPSLNIFDTIIFFLNINLIFTFKTVQLLVLQILYDVPKN